SASAGSTPNSANVGGQEMYFNGINISFGPAPTPTPAPTPAPAPAANSAEVNAQAVQGTAAFITNQEQTMEITTNGITAFVSAFAAANSVNFNNSGLIQQQDDMIVEEKEKQKFGCL